MSTVRANDCRESYATGSDRVAIRSASLSTLRARGLPAFYRLFHISHKNYW